MFGARSDATWMGSGRTPVSHVPSAKFGTFWDILGHRTGKDEGTMGGEGEC